MERRRWPILIRPSTRAFTREARRIPGYSFLDWLHGYVYIRWPYLYLAIGSGKHPLARLLGPPVRLVGRLFPAPTRHDRETGTLADGYHGKVVPLEVAAQLVTVREDVTLTESIDFYYHTIDFVIQVQPLLAPAETNIYYLCYILGLFDVGINGQAEVPESLKRPVVIFS